MPNIFHILCVCLSDGAKVTADQSESTKSGFKGWIKSWRAEALNDGHSDVVKLLDS